MKIDDNHVLIATFCSAIDMLDKNEAAPQTMISTCVSMLGAMGYPALESNAAATETVLLLKDRWARSLMMAQTVSTKGIAFMSMVTTAQMLIDEKSIGEDFLADAKKRMAKL